MENLFGAPTDETQIRRSGFQGPGKKIPGHPGPRHPMYRQAYQTWYSPSRLPAADDPGWEKKGKTGKRIRVHGPFDIESDDGTVLEHCMDGWLCIQADGSLGVEREEE